MKILLLGKDGQVGHALTTTLTTLGSVIALSRHQAHNPDNLVGDLADTAGLIASIRAVQPDVIVNAAAYTAVDRAESEPELARQVNALAPGAMAEELTRSGGWLVHYSTDYVFDGRGTRAWQEDDATAPLSTYGRTKLEGEAAIRASGCQHLILRTSWVYAAHGNNFLKTMLRLAGERETLSVVADQIGAPTSAGLLAKVTAQILPQSAAHPALSGTYHCAPAGETSWYDYAQFVFQEARKHGANLRVQPESVAAIATSAYPTPAARPQNSRLNCGLLQRRFNLQLPHWQEDVRETVAELCTPQFT